MKISVVSYSLSQDPASLPAWEEKLCSQIQKLQAEGAKIILYPELFLLGVGLYFSQDLKEVAQYIQGTLLPRVETLLKGKDVLLCLGSGPRDLNGKIYNSSPVWVNDTWLFQDKIHLTPWENDFTAGSEVNFFLFHGLRAAVLICYDVEQPGLALKLKRSGLDLLLVPSATANKNGNQRVNRCASARSIELGALVVTAPLIGDSKNDLVDHSEGRQGFFLPAQEVVVVEQEEFSAYSVSEEVVKHYELEVKMLKDLKLEDEETKPYFKEDMILP